MRGRSAVTVAPSTWRWVGIVVRTAVTGGLLLLARYATAESPRPSLLLVTVDTARADHLSLYGYHAGHLAAPRGAGAVRRLLRDGISPIPQTGPACATLLTGRWPASLGMHANEQRLGPGPRDPGEVLGGAGYATAGFVSGLSAGAQARGARPRLRPLRRRAARPARRLPGASGGRPHHCRGARLARRAPQGPPVLPVGPLLRPPRRLQPAVGRSSAMFLDGSEGSLPDPDAIPDYQRHGGSTDAADYVARYDGELRSSTSELGKLLDGLEARGLLPGDARRGDRRPRREPGRARLLLRPRQRALHGGRARAVRAGRSGVPADGRRIGGVARTPDVMPTLLELLGVGAPQEAEGRSLVAALASRLGGTAARGDLRGAPRAGTAADADRGRHAEARGAGRPLHGDLARGDRELELYDRLPTRARRATCSPAGRWIASEDKLRTACAGGCKARPRRTRGGPDTQVITPDVRRPGERVGPARGPRGEADRPSRARGRAGVAGLSAPWLVLAAALARWPASPP